MFHACLSPHPVTGNSACRLGDLRLPSYDCFAGLQCPIVRDSNDKDVAAMLVEQTIEAN